MEEIPTPIAHRPPHEECHWAVHLSYLQEGVWFDNCGLIQDTFECIISFCGSKHSWPGVHQQNTGGRLHCIFYVYS